MSGAVLAPAGLAAPAAGRLGPAWRGLVRAALPWLLPALLLLAWQAGSMAGWIAEEVLPAPSAVLAAGWELARSGELLRNIEVSTWRALTGFAIGGGLGLGFGVLTGLSRLGERLLDSSVQMLRNIPHLALIPLVILWFGIDEAAKLFLVALGSFFPVYVNTMHGVRSVDPQLVEMGRAYGMDAPTLFRRIVLPGALPSVFVGLRYGLGIMWLTLIVAETIAANSGIGYMAMHAREFMLVDVVVFSILVYALLGKLADSLARLLERLCLSWNPAYRSA
ncbi:aliphatic sulfonate ABC transporter permease SsuC [Roseicella frigidaeris]|uniref:Aliphatic sulfonate ABC transporter permease SsuC n=1 Tax=Roseicella frigidaeris TaxID=2230885 RepID=A0A327M5Y6_9PROT|nr:aliphatic sulfonate ABC transporter permease SsuC [Roseicella frigidaeris]RAI57724.1 aliphatic sulfonate ABC transporter permease SsuC [Roseicella frigidaeris]